METIFTDTFVLNTKGFSDTIDMTERVTKATENPGSKTVSLRFSVPVLQVDYHGRIRIGRH
jgi:hypothetical protein